MQILTLRLLSVCDDASEDPTAKRQSRGPNDDITTPINGQIEQVAKRHHVPSDTVKCIISVGLICKPVLKNNTAT